ncbi:hypothetical protein BC629DRAFT_1298421 [Irpex lacteus]|nr:hypothetical protein BC629DRAFT_1298421 [Irpex lacteus]
MRRRQFPVRLAFSVTINKAQEQSIEIRVPVFTHGQLYVALSRAISAHRIKVLLPHDSRDRRVDNVVYEEVLL